MITLDPKLFRTPEERAAEVLSTPAKNLRFAIAQAIRYAQQDMREICALQAEEVAEVANQHKRDVATRLGSVGATCTAAMIRELRIRPTKDRRPEPNICYPMLDPNGALGAEE